MKRLLINIPVLINSGISPDKIECEYMYHRENEGHFSLLEVAEFSVYCRQCKEAFCIEACPKVALEHQGNGMIRRYNMRCVGCKSCVLACPFGTIFPEIINYITSKCDYCLNQLEHNPDYKPACVITAPDKTFMIIELDSEDPKNNLFFIGDRLAVRSRSWRYKENRI